MTQYLIAAAVRIRPEEPLPIWCLSARSVADTAGRSGTLVQVEAQQCHILSCEFSKYQMRMTIPIFDDAVVGGFLLPPPSTLIYILRLSQ
jgi:hypothetical protein